MLLTQSKRSLSVVAALLPVLACVPLAAQAPLHQTVSVAATRAPHYGKVPLYFEQNQGQAKAAARFVAHGPGYSIQLQPAEATLVLHSADDGGRRPRRDHDGAAAYR